MSQANSVFTASSAGCKLIASGTIIPLDSGPFILGIPNLENEDQGLRLQITLERDEKDTKSHSRLSGDPEDTKLIHLKIVNLESPFGGGPEKALELWRSPNDQILLQLRMYTQGSSPPTVHFSFYSKHQEGQP